MVEGLAAERLAIFINAGLLRHTMEHSAAHAEPIVARDDRLGDASFGAELLRGKIPVFTRSHIPAGRKVSGGPWSPRLGCGHASAASSNGRQFTFDRRWRGGCQMAA